MAEINSRQAAANALGNKLKNSENGRRRAAVVQTPAVFAALNINDTIAGGQFIPAGSRIVGCKIGNGAGTAASTLAVGLRKRSDGTVISATAIVVARAITAASAIVTEVADGTYVVAGVEQVLADDAEVYLTALGAVLAANQVIRIEIEYIGA